MIKSPLNASRSSHGARGLLCFALAGGFTHAADAPPNLVQQVLGEYCFECHDTDVQKGDRSYEKFDLPLKGTADLDNPAADQAAIEKLQSLGVPAKQTILNDAKHGCWMQKPWFEQCVAAVNGWLMEHLK